VKSFRSDERGSAVVNFIFASIGVLGVFAAVLVIVVNLYLRTVMTSSATDAARLMARADVSTDCQTSSDAMAQAIAKAKQGVESLTSAHLLTSVSANVQQIDGLCESVVSINANLPGLPLIDAITNFFAQAHATLEFQQ